MKNTVNLNSGVLVHADSLEFIKTLPDNSVDAVITDPPYYRVKSHAWDNQWPTVADYLAWLDEFLGEFWRILKPSGSLYLFCGHKLSTDTELLVRERFNVLNHIIWAKPSGPWKKTHKEGLRSYFPSTERIIFAEHYGAEGSAKGQSGYATKCSELKGRVFSPLINYFREARKRLGISAAVINAATGTQMCSHWFSKSQWQLPSEKQYLALQELFNQVAAEKGLIGLESGHGELREQYGVLSSRYNELLTQYSDLRQRYEYLRRPFSVTTDVPYTDVWTYPPVQHYPGKHPCEKPIEMMLDIVSACCRPGDVVADFFMGSGSTIKAALQLGCSVIGVELEEERFLQTVSEIEQQ